MLGVIGHESYWASWPSLLIKSDDTGLCRPDRRLIYLAPSNSAQNTPQEGPGRAQLLQLVIYTDHFCLWHGFLVINPTPSRKLSCLDHFYKPILGDLL